MSVTVDHHLTILAGSENLDRHVRRFRKELLKAEMPEETKVTLGIWLAGIEGVADYLREKAEIIAETQP